MKKVEYNYNVDFLRFIFSIIIIFAHSWLFAGENDKVIFSKGGYAIIFFLITTGYLMMNSIYREKDNKNIGIGLSTFNFLKRKFKKLFPYLIVCFFINNFIALGHNIFNLKLLFCDNLVSEFFLLTMVGYYPLVNIPIWYISVMFIVLMIFYPIAKKTKDNFIYLFAPLIILFLMALKNSQGLDLFAIYESKSLFYSGFYVSVIFILVGCLCFKFVSYIKQKKPNKKMLTILEVLIYLALIFNMNDVFLGNIAIGILFSIAVSISFSGQSYTSQLFKSNKWKKLGHIGFLMFLINVPVRTFITKLQLNLSYIQHVSLFLISVFVVAMIIHLTIDIIYPYLIVKYKNLKKKKL